MKTISIKVLIISVLALITACNSQNIHPYKQKFIDYNAWPATTPAEIDFKNFKPYRAVYSRTYTSHATKETVNDKVIMTAQRVAWYGKSVILFEYHDAASTDFKETNARTQFYYLDEKTLQMYMAVGPKVGTPQDYTTVRVLDDKITSTRINTATGAAEFKELKTDKPSFGLRQLRFLMWAAMDLKIGDKIKLFPIYIASQAAPAPSLGIVTKKVDYTTPDNKRHRPFIVENTNNPTTASVNRFYVINEAPYLLAQGIFDADKKEITRWWLKLDSFEFLGE